MFLFLILLNGYLHCNNNHTAIDVSSSTMFISVIKVDGQADMFQFATLVIPSKLETQIQTSHEERGTTEIRGVNLIRDSHHNIKYPSINKGQNIFLVHPTIKPFTAAQRDIFIDLLKIPKNFIFYSHLAGLEFKFRHKHIQTTTTLDTVKADIIFSELETTVQRENKVTIGKHNFRESQWPGAGAGPKK